MSRHKKKRAAEIAQIMNEWDTDDDLADEESVDIPDTDFHLRVVDRSYESSAENPPSNSREPPPSASEIGRDGTVWAHVSTCASVGRTSSHNIFTASPGC